MIEARIFTNSLRGARKKLKDLNAISQGRYVLDDDIFRNMNDSIPLGEEFLRLRVISENIWEEKPVVLALKRTELRVRGKDSRIPLKLQFDTRAEAEGYYTRNLRDEYVLDFSFSRVGWQYFLPNGDVVDLEILEGTHPTIEFKSKTDEGIQKLLEVFAVNDDEVMKGPSVVAFRDAVTRNRLP